MKSGVTLNPIVGLLFRSHNIWYFEFCCTTILTTPAVLYDMHIRTKLENNEPEKVKLDVGERFVLNEKKKIQVKYLFWP